MSTRISCSRQLFWRRADNNLVNIGVIPVANLVGQTGLAAQYGGKVAGYANLLGVQAESKVPFEIPEAWAIPPAAVHEASEAELRTAFDALTKRIKGRRILMARSSHLHESPGQYDSPMMTVGRKPSRLSRWADSLFGRKTPEDFERFRNTVRRMQEDPEMGVLATLNVAQTPQTLDGRETLGGDLVSFVANTHSPMKPLQLYIAMAQGLGTRVVMAGGDAIPICVNRDDRRITFIGNRSTRSMDFFEGALTPALPERDNYQQKAVDVWDIEQGKIFSTSFKDHFMNGANCFIALIHGRLQPSDGFGRSYRSCIGLSPFDDPLLLENLAGILTYLSGTLGPSQIEGAFPTRASATPWLYQWISIPEIRRDTRPLKPFQPHLTSDSVVGSGTFEGPLIYLGDIMHLDGLEALDKKFAETGYILVTLNHPREVVLATPHCRCRLSFDSVNMGSHAATVMLHQIAANPEAGFVWADFVKIKTAHDQRKGKMFFNGIPSREHKRWCYIFNARLDANGEEMVVEILP